jgi:hypothetical protein
MQTWTDRPLVPGDGPLLAQATLGNLNWREQRFTARDVEVRPEFRHYAQMVRNGETSGSSPSAW